MVIILPSLRKFNGGITKYRKKYHLGNANFKPKDITDDGEKKRLEDILKNSVYRSNFIPNESATGTYSKLY